MPKFNVALNQREEPLLATPIDFSASGDNTVIVGVSGLLIKVYRYFLVVAQPTNLTFKNGAVALTGAVPLTSNEAMVFTFDTMPWFTMTAGASFVINSSGGGQVSGAAYYTQEQA
jgi:hypothetical protein